MGYCTAERMEPCWIRKIWRLLALEKRCLELLSEEEETTPVVWGDIPFGAR